MELSEKIATIKEKISQLASKMSELRSENTALIEENSKLKIKLQQDAEALDVMKEQLAAAKAALEAQSLEKVVENEEGVGKS